MDERQRSDDHAYQRAGPADFLVYKDGSPAVWTSKRRDGVVVLTGGSTPEEGGRILRDTLALPEFTVGWVYILDTTQGEAIIPNIELQTTPVTINKKHIRLTGYGPSGLGVSPRGTPWIHGTVDDGGLIQITNADNYTLEGLLVENAGSNGIGISVAASSARGKMRAVHAINCAKDGIAMTTNQVGQSLIEQCGAAGCGNGLAFRSGNGTPGAAPNAVMVRSGRYENNGVNIYAQNRDPLAGGNALIISGVSLGGTGTGVLVEGWSGLTIDGQCYFELGETANAPYVKIRGVPGADADNENNWAHDISIRECYFHNFSAQPGWTAGVGKHVDADSCFNLHVDDIQHVGELANISADNPVYRLGTRTKGCRLFIPHVSGPNAGSKEKNFGRILKDETAGTPQGNWGYWWNPDRNTRRGGYKYWGDLPGPA